MGEAPGGAGASPPWPPSPENKEAPAQGERPKRKGRPPKAEKQTPGGGGAGKTAKTATRGKTAGKSASAKEEALPPPAPAPEEPPQPKDASRGEKEEIVYLDLSQLHPFQDHPFGVRDDNEMKGLVSSVRAGGVHQPALVRPREGGGYEIIAGHRRQGIVPLWASEIEKAPVSITKRHFPDMEHLGDITRLHGGEVPPVDVIIFGSPCQNLSSAGRREGLGGAKSSLFFQAVRIIEEMRAATGGQFPTIVIWKNVMGALLSGNRLDFKAVLQSLTNTEIPMPASGRWANAGMVRGGGRDVCWRLLDVQHWADPRLARRQRVFVVADFGGRRARAVLFKPCCLFPAPAPCGDFGLPPAGGNRISAFETGGRYQSSTPFKATVCGGDQGGGRGELPGELWKTNRPFSHPACRRLTVFALWREGREAEGVITWLTPTEGERAMGLPDGWTAYGHDGRSARARQKALGNSIADYIQGILSRKAQTGKSGYSQSLYNLKDAANMLNFLQANNIMDMTGLDEKFKTMIGEQLDIQGKLKPVERRLGTLKKHIEQADIYFKYKGKKPLTEAEQILFATAKDYLKGVMNGKTTIPTKAWKEEYTKLTAERKTLNQRYLALKEEVKEAEKIRKSVYSILRQEQREQQPRKAQDMER